MLVANGAIFTFLNHANCSADECFWYYIQDIFTAYILSTSFADFAGIPNDIKYIDLTFNESNIDYET